MIYSVELPTGSFLFASANDAQAFAEKENQRWIKNFSLNPRYEAKAWQKRRFRQEEENDYLFDGPGQEKCRRVMRHVYRWHADRERWWDSL